MSAQPTAANGAMGAISATTPRTVALLLLVPCPLCSGALLPSIFDGREQVFQEIGAPLCGLFPFIVMFLVFSPFRQRVKT